jgi:hypothetical protein
MFDSFEADFLVKFDNRPKKTDPQPGMIGP